jgi:hypothetical protein
VPLSLAGALLLASSAARAITITVTGAPGANGAAGVDGGPGAPADATAISADPTNTATATGGNGGSSGILASGGAGGAGSARAETNVAGPANAVATATGGNGGAGIGAGEQGGDGGSAAAQALANGAGGSEARAVATGGRGGNTSFGAVGGSGGDALLADAVSGSDATELTFEQRATGGDGSARGGDAQSTGDFTNASGGSLSALLVAIGGNGGSEAGDAHVGGSVTSVGAGDATLEAIARTGSGPAGGGLVIEPLLAHATGTGNASASLEAELQSASGILSLTNRLDAIASSDAAIRLRQTAKAVQTSESILDVSKSAALLDLEANADGGDASILVRGSNDAGDLRLHGQALGGRAIVDPFGARAEFEAHTSGDGHDIEIGAGGRPAGAEGGRGDRGDIAGGDAEVIATATALGNSAVHIDVVATGGDVDNSANGGATAHANGSGGGTEAVDVAATALGGRGFFSTGGDALAETVATGLGAVSARAIAHGGVHDENTPGGAGFARARANGASGAVEAVASTTRLFDGEQSDDEQLGPVVVGLVATLAGDTVVAASSHLSDFGPDAVDPTLDGFIRSAYQADAALLDAALSGNPLAESMPVAEPFLYALVELQAKSGGGIAQSFTAEIVLGPDRFSEFDDLPEAVGFSFLDPELDADAFGSLTLRSFDTRDPSDIYQIVFTSALDALAFLDDGRLVFGGLPRQRHLEIIFETTGAEGAFFLDLVAATVPEPSAAAMLALLALCGAGSARYRYTLFRSPMRKTTTLRTRSSIE